MTPSNKQAKVSELLRELLAEQPELVTHKARIESLLADIVDLNEDVHIDQAFKNRLKAELILQQPKSFTHIIKELFTMQKLTYALTALVLVAIGAGASGYYLLQHQTIKTTTQLFSSETQINALSKNAFGSLSNTQAQGIGGGMAGGLSMSSMANSPQPVTSNSVVTENIGKTPETPAAAPVASPVSDRMISAVAPDAKMIAPYEPYRFVYGGDKLNLTETDGTVYRRVKNSTASTTAANVLKTFSLGLIDLNKFQNLGVQSFTLAENKDFGYMVTVNTQDGVIYINENYNTWNYPERMCQDEACYNKYRLKASDIPADGELIKIADKFISDFGISKKTYGDPIVQRYGPISIASNASDAYIPDVLNIIYPLKINGQVIMDEGGYPNGLNIAVNIRHKKVSYVSELYSNTFDSSTYPLETNGDRILKAAMPTFQGQENSSNVVTLGTPTQGLIRTWTYNNMSNQELFVPALIFPVVSSNPKNPYYAKQVAVPLVKEILDQRLNQNGGPGYPVPLSEPAVMMQVK